MEPADSIGHVDEAGFADAYDDEGDSFLPPQRDLDRMKLGASLLKVNESGKARKRHIQVSKDFKSIQWLPSKKKDSEFINFDNVMQVLLGTESPALAKLNVNSKVAAEFISRSSSMAVRPGQYFLSGFLMKKGGSKGGRRNWTKRWHVLNGHSIQYFKNPKDTTPKGEFSVLRAVAAPVLDSKYEYCFEIKIAGGEVRYFRADNAAELEEWLSTIRRAAIMPVGAAGAFHLPTGPPSSANSTPVSREDSETKSLEDVLEQSFSLIGKPGTLSLHIVCSSKEECDFWYRGIQGLVAYQKASVEASIQVYQEAVDRNPSDVMCRVNLGLAMLRQDRTSDALAQLSRAAEMDGGNAQAHRALSKALDKLGKVDEAIVHAQRAAAIRVQDPELFIMLGSLHLKVKHVDDAIVAFEAALKINPSIKEAHVRLADLFLGSGREVEAKVHYEEALRVDPSYKWAHVNLGLSLERQGDVGAAIDHYNKALKIDENFVPALFNLGQAHDRLGNPVESEKIYERCLKLQPGNVMFLTQVAYIRMVTSLDAALPLFEKAAEIGKSAACHLNYGIALEAKELGMANVDKQLTSPTKGWTHNLEQAEEQYKSALMLQPGSERARYSLALLLKRKGTDLEACVELREVIRRNPAFKDPAGLAAVLGPLMSEHLSLLPIGVVKTRRTSSVASRGPSPVVGSPGGGSDPLLGSSPRRDDVPLPPPGPVTPSFVDIAGGSVSDLGTVDEDTVLEDVVVPIASESQQDPSQEFSASVPAFDFARKFATPLLSAEERQREFILTMKREKEAAEAEAKRKKQEEFDRLSSEEQEKRREEEALNVKHEAKKEKMLTSQMRAYSKSSAALMASGRGRGRGRK